MEGTRDSIAAPDGQSTCLIFQGFVIDRLHKIKQNENKQHKCSLLDDHN